MKDLPKDSIANHILTMAAPIAAGMAALTIVAQGLIFTCSSRFQGLVNTVPSLMSSGTRLLTFAMPVWWLSTQSNFKIEQVWYLSIASATFQAMVSLLLLRREFKKRLKFAAR